jgi:hypothetical protein
VIAVKPSPTADTRTCDYTKVSAETLLESSKQHIRDVSAAMSYFSDELLKAANQHDIDKITGIKQFHDDFITGFKTTGWWDNHRKISRHHLLSADGVPPDVNLIDVIEMIADCVMAGMARSGSVYPLNISPELLLVAFQNTVAKLKAQITLEALDE